MKKGLFAAILTLALGVVFTPAFATEPDTTNYLWYTQGGRAIHSEENSEVVTDFEGQRFFFSADGGASYAELPGLKEQSERVWSDYTLSVAELPGGSLRIKGRNLWEGEYTWQKTYTAGEISAALTSAQPTPVHVMASNGAVTVGTCQVKGYCNDDPAKVGWEGDNRDEYGQCQLVYSTDGVTWTKAAWPEGTAVTIHCEAWWDGTAFRTCGKASPFAYGQETPMVSTDGKTWSVAEGEERRTPKSPYACDLGPYHFEMLNAVNYDEDVAVYLTGDSADTGVLLPHITDAIKAGVGDREIQAWYGPADTVIVAVYETYANEPVCSMVYPISSLDWCLENLSVKFREIEPQADSGTLRLGTVAHRFYAYASQCQVLRQDDSGRWEPLKDVPWGSTVQVLPYNGKTFLVMDTGVLKLYASEDGLDWREVDALKPEGMSTYSYDYIKYAFSWTGKGYIACREAAVSRHGMMGHAGGQWYDGNTKVYFLDEDFQLAADSYDFSRLVEDVGYADGIYYAQVANSDGLTYMGFTTYHSDENGEYYTYDDGKFNPDLGSALYRSKDGKTWEKTDIIRMPEQQ